MPLVHDESRQGESFFQEETPEQNPVKRHFYIETYGCQMNFSDTEIVASVLTREGFSPTQDFLNADLVLLNTCSIRENAEQKVRNRLTEFRKIKRKNPEALVGVLGCMAERLKSKFLEEEKIVDLVVGPDAYRDLPRLITLAEEGQRSVNVLLSREETYADISPVRLGSNGVTAFISIMRGCNNMCSFCVVPFTRGRERSRDPLSIVQEARELFEQGFREVTLLGQNVDSYCWKKEKETPVTFADLLIKVAEVHPLLRVRFSTSHPKDITDEVLFAMLKFQNICHHIHLPVQSGSSEVLKRMNRTYDRSWYQMKVDRIRQLIPDCGLTTDIITGFCGETDDDHLETLSLMESIKYDMAYMFKYSERPGTYAEKNIDDDVPESVKSKRLQEIIDLQAQHQLTNNQLEVGKMYPVLVEGTSKRSPDYLFGRNPQSKVIVFPKENFSKGEYVNVKVTDFTSATLIGSACLTHH